MLCIGTRDVKMGMADRVVLEVYGITVVRSQLLGDELARVGSPTALPTVVEM